MFVISLNAKTLSDRIQLFLGLIAFAFSFLLRGKYCWVGNVNLLSKTLVMPKTAAKVEYQCYEMNQVNSIHQRASFHDSVK
ncbi:hypothetical protein ACE02U_15640 [Shewanella xiamenensis]|uniref:hypothetical protein n=1 Tax=Shewanella xiamenensis TaxID=332186 RepID=UPI0035B9BA94